MSYSVNTTIPMNNPSNKLNSNVRIVLDTNYTENAKENMTENSWEILQVAQMNTLIFPHNIKSSIYETDEDNDGNKDTDSSKLEVINAKDEKGNDCWCPTNVDIAIVMQTIGNANITKKSDTVESTCPSFINIKDYLSKDETSGLSNRPCGFLTPRETLMPMMLIPTKKFIQNGLVTVENAQIGNYEKTYSVREKDYFNCFNWIVDINKEDGTNKFKELKYYGSIQITQEDFSFINCSTAVNEKENNSSDVNEKGICTRHYCLDDNFLNTENSFYTLPETSTTGDITSESYIIPPFGGAFGFCYKFHGAKSGENKYDNSRISLKLSNSDMEFNIPKTGNIEFTQTNKNKSYGSVTKSENTQKMGQLSEKTFKDGVMLIFYPVWNGIAVTGGIDDKSRLKNSEGTINITVDNGFIAYNNKDVEMSDYTIPSMNEYNTSKPEEMRVTDGIYGKDDGFNKEPVYFNWDPRIDIYTINCLASFAYTPIFFQKNLKFSIFIRDNSGRDILTEVSKELGKSDTTRDHYLYPIYFNNNTEYVINEKLKGMSIGTKIILNKTDEDLKDEEFKETDKEIFYRFDFECCHKGGEYGLYPRRGVEIFGFFHQVQSKNKKRTIDNSNGKIEGDFSAYLEKGFAYNFNKNYGNYKNILTEGLENDNWLEFATDISVNRSIEQSGGTINLDKYAMLSQYQRPPQPVGEVRLKATKANNKIYSKYSESVPKDKETDVFFTGLGIGISYQDTSQSDTMTLNLHGIEKKLQDIKLAGSPYFDGDPIETVMKYLSEYANFQYEFNNKFYSYKYGENGLTLSETEINASPEWMRGKNAPCPRSVEFQRPAINFLLGTTVYEAIKMVCEKTNKTFFITKKGVVRIVDQNVYGIPINVAYSIAERTPSLRLRSDQILNISLQPYFENVYNQVITASLKGKRCGSEFPVKTSINTDDMMPNILYSRIPELYDEENEMKPTGIYDQTFINFPWSRMIVQNEMAILSTKEAEKIHSVNCNQFSYPTFSGGITIPGIAELELFDTISIIHSKALKNEKFDINGEIEKEEEIFYITGISHSYSSSSRVWTTQLQVGHLHSSLASLKLTVFSDNPNKRKGES